MQGTIIIADLLAEEANSKARKQAENPPAARKSRTSLQGRKTANREAEALADWLRRQRIGAYSMAVQEYAACRGDRAEQAKVWSRWGDTLAQAFAYRKKQRQILADEYRETLANRDRRRTKPLGWRKVWRGVWQILWHEV